MQKETLYALAIGAIVGLGFTAIRHNTDTIAKGAAQVRNIGKRVMLPDDFNVGVSARKYPPESSSQLVVHPYVEPSDVNMPDVNLEVFATAEGKRIDMYTGPWWKDGKEVGPSFERMLAYGGFITSGWGHPENREAPPAYVSRRWEGKNVTITYRIDPENKLNEKNRADNVAIFTIGPTELESAASDFQSERYFEWSRARRQEELSEKIRDLESSGYKVTKE
jgi:hypothetical protein